MNRKTPSQRAKAIRASYAKRIARAESMVKKWTAELNRLERERNDKELAIFNENSNRRRK